MATVTEATNVLAEHTGEPGLRLDQYARYLQNARILPVAAAPRSPLPQLEAHHLAALVIGCLASPTAIDAPKAVREFGSLPAGPPYEVADDAGEPSGARREPVRRPGLAATSDGRDFAAALAALIDRAPATEGEYTIVAVGAGTRAGVPFAFIDVRDQPRRGSRAGPVRRRPFGPRQGGGLQRVNRLPGAVVREMAQLLAPAADPSEGGAS